MQNSLWISSVIVITCTAFLAWRGYQRGLIRALQRFISLFCAYAACYFFAVPLSGLFQQHANVPSIGAMVLSSLALFFSVSIVVGIAINLLAKLIESKGVETARVSGAFAGGALGMIFGLLAIWLGGILLDGLQVQSTSQQSEISEPDLLRVSVGKAIGGIAERAMENSMGHGGLLPQMTGELLSNPVKMSQKVMDVSKGQAMQAFFSDPFAQHAMLINRQDVLMNNQSFKYLMADPETASLLAGLHEGKTKNSSEASQAAQALTDMYQRSIKVQKDKRYLKLKESGDMDRIAQSKSIFELVRNPAFTEMGQIILDAAKDGAPLQSIEKPVWEKLNAGAPTAAPQGLTGEGSARPITQALIYRWVDASGRKHYSEQRPENILDVEVISQ